MKNASLLAFFYLIITSAAFGQAKHTLKTDYIVSPVGVDNKHPRLTWQFSEIGIGNRQTAYQVFIDHSEGSKKMSTWTSPRITSYSQLFVYNGPALKPFQKYYWKVAVWDEKGQRKVSETGTFEMGMIESGNWKGTWISDGQNIRVKPAPYFRKEFIPSKKIAAARAYVAAGGLYELYLNGNKVGDHRLDPTYTRYDRRNLYVAYDVTAQLKSASKNAVGIILGNGWYNHQSTAVWDFERAPWRARPAFCLDLRITYEDGSVETITSGKDWKTSLGPIIFNSIYTAEHYDARLDMPGWNVAGFDASKWKNVYNRASPSGNIVAQQLHPIRNVERIPAVSFKQVNDTTWLYDLGRNISGVSEITVSGTPGTVLRLKHAERLGKDGRVDQSNIDVHYRPTDNQDPFQTDVFTLKGSGHEQFMPLFNYKGFQYVEVTANKSLNLTKESLSGYFMHSDVPVAGKIHSSNETINKIWSATNNSYLSNLFGYPTDCPQREKNGWTGDAQIAIETGLYNFDGITVYEKWMDDHRDEQQPNGVLPSIIPTGGWGYEWGNGPDWTSTIAIIPWNIYLFYGDTKILRDNYAGIVKYVDHITDISPSGLTTWGLGDWVPVKSKAPVELTSSAYYFTDALILSKIAKVLGHTQDEQKYARLAAKIKNAVNEKYLNKETGIYGAGTQTELSVPLFWKIVPPELTGKVAAALAKRVEADGFHLDVGLLGTKSILNALSLNGYPDIAYKVASQETFPSWGWWIVNGATTLYENWPIDAASDISRNHIMFGEIGAWLFKSPGGIYPDENAPGFKNVILSPDFMKDLSFFEARHTGPYGEILSSWKREGNAVHYKLTIPANSSATLEFPNGLKVTRNGIVLTGKAGKLKTNYQLPAGNHQLVIR